MKILNIGCGATRPKERQWINLDQLRSVLQVGTPERTNLDQESNYVDHDIKKRLPFVDEVFDGVVHSHVLEHFDAKDGVNLMKECYRVIKPKGWLMVSVPNAAYFREQYPFDCSRRAIELFGEPIFEPDGESTFFGYALWNRYHKAILTEDSLWAYFVRAGFKHYEALTYKPWNLYPETVREMSKILNRIKFSLVMVAQK
jgi:SAM-dependent methyltransferase